MWFKIDLDGMTFELKIKNYMPNQTLDGSWAKVSYYFKFHDVINYSADNCELLLNCEIDDIRDYIEKLLNDKLNKKINYECIEPDFNFIFNPKYDLSNDPSYVYLQPGTEIVDIDMELKVNLWNGGLTTNYFSTTFGRREIEQLYLYLSLITRKIKIEDLRVKKLIDSGIIYGEMHGK